jgi:coenzyme F420 biosynthesis associated uncharacterized protein
MRHPAPFCPKEYAMYEDRPARASTIPRSLGAALLMGGAASFLLMAARRYGRERADEILDWDQITSIAGRASVSAAPIPQERLDAAADEYAAMLREISGPLSAYTGTEMAFTERDVRAVERREWIETNIGNFKELLAPFEQAYREASGRGRADWPGLTAVGRLALSGEVGMLMGYLARRVLGQYDISLLGARAEDPGKLYFVEPNIEGVQTQLGLPAREFRVWLALHEATHAHEFEGHPWVREYLNSTLQRYLNAMLGQLHNGGGSIGGFVGNAVDRLLVGGTILEALLPPEQRQLVSQLQALMSLLEGYSTHVMNAIGKRLLPHFEEIEYRVDVRSKRKSAAELLFLRLTGLQMKLDQYRLGNAFVSYIEEHRGIAFMNRVWDGPDFLPSEEEIREPERWVRRMERVAA